MFSEFNAFQLDEVSHLQVYDGHCQYEDIVNTRSYIVAYSLQNCYNQCKMTAKCTAFSYEWTYDRQSDCRLHIPAGSNIKGDGEKNAKCYAMYNTGNSTNDNGYY